MAADPALNSLTDALRNLAPGEANTIMAAKEAIELAADPNAWQNAVKEYRAIADRIVSDTLQDKFGMIPGLADMLPALVSEVADIQRPISLGPATLSLNMPSVQLRG